MEETLTTPESRRRSHRAPLARDRRFRLGAVVAVAAVVGIVLSLVLRSGGGGSTAPRSTHAVPVTPRGLRTLVGALRQPIYWIGSQGNVTYELSRATGGRIFIRY